MQATRLGLATLIGFSLAGCVQPNAIQPVGVASAPALQQSRAGEARIGQAEGRVFISDEAASNIKTKPVVSGAGPIGSASRPLTCGQQNTTDPACHTATQQSRPPTR
jgi:hypothetical protein